MNIHKIEQLIAFIFGDLFVTLWITTGDILADFGHFGIRVISTVVIGLAGGLAGMGAKDLYPWFKKWLRNLFKKRIKK